MSEPIRTPDENPSRVESILSDTIGLPGYEIEAPRSRIEKLLVNLDGTIHNLPDYAASISVEMDSNFVMSVSLLNKNGDVLGEAQEVDLPLEAVVVDGRYDSVNKQLVLELQNGNFINIPISDLISGLQEEITSNNKLSADLVDDSNTTNKFNVQADWNESSSSAQSYINNKPTLGTAAAAAATDFATSAQGSKADSAIQSVKVGDSALTPDANKAVTITKSDITGLGIPAQDTTYVFEGTYNATTNKAATMADIKDGKLTGYAQSSGNVAATDKVIEAIGKVEKKADDNKTNILSNWELGKNYLKLTRDSIKAANSSFTWNGYTATANQVTFTINEDLSITMSGTASTTFEFVLISRLSNTFYLPTGDYYLSGAIGGGDALNIAMNRTVSGSGVRYGADSGSGLDITVTDSTASTGIWIAINSGTPTNTTFKPMIISKANKDNGNTDYQPYAMSNVELTSNILSNASYSGTSSTTTFAAFLKNAANALGINGRNACEVAVYGAGSGEYLLMFFIYEADVYEYHTTLANNVISLSAANSAGTLALSGGTAPYKASVRFLA